MKDVKRKVGEVYTRNGRQYEVKICTKCHKKKYISVSSRFVICRNCKKQMEEGTELGHDLNDVCRAVNRLSSKRRKAESLLRLRRPPWGRNPPSEKSRRRAEARRRLLRAKLANMEEVDLMASRLSASVFLKRAEILEVKRGVR